MNAELNDALAERERELERLRKELNDEGDDEVMTVQQLALFLFISLARWVSILAILIRLNGQG